jgi:hypothetical protein
MLFSLGIAALSAFLMCLFTIWHQCSLELHYRAKFGSNWQEQFEIDIGSLSEGRTKAVVSAFGIIAITLLLIWLKHILRPNYSHRSREKQKWKPGVHVSPLERVVRYRRRALVGIYFGLGGIIAGALLVIFRFGIFNDHANEMVLGIMIFFCGYCAVIAGCGSWLKAKGWNDAIAFIGVMPLGVLCIPFVRLIFVAAPMLLPVGMIFMPLVLFVVVLVLPDKSGLKRSKGRLSRRHY